MYLCDKWHEEICTETKDCPLCSAIKAKESLEEELNDVRNELKSVIAEKEMLESKIEKLRTTKE